MKKYPIYIESLITDLQSSELANEILERYSMYSSDPNLEKLYQSYSECQNQFFYSSQALALLRSEIPILNLNDTFAKTYHEHDFNLLVSEKQSKILDESLVQNSSLSTLWSEASIVQSSHKTLKQLSYDVRQFIIAKGHCTYKEVADEIAKNQACINEKNVRRRVYDAINVLTAANVIEKKGKQICIVEKDFNASKNVNQKKENLRRLCLKYLNLSSVILKNKASGNPRQAVQLPFIVILTTKNVRHR